MEDDGNQRTREYDANVRQQWYDLQVKDPWPLSGINNRRRGHPDHGKNITEFIALNPPSNKWKEEINRARHSKMINHGM